MVVAMLIRVLVLVKQRAKRARQHLILRGSDIKLQFMADRWRHRYQTAVSF